MDFQQVILLGIPVSDQWGFPRDTFKRAKGHPVFAIIYFKGQDEPKIKALPTDSSTFCAELVGLRRASEHGLLQFSLYYIPAENPSN